MAATCVFQDQSFWLTRGQCEEAETKYHAALTALKHGDAKCNPLSQSTTSSLASEIEKARNQIKQSLNIDASSSAADSSVVGRIVTLERENHELRQITCDLQTAVKKLESKIAALEVSGGGSKPAAAKPAKAAAKEESDEDFDLFGSDEESEDEEEDEQRQARLKAYHDKKAKKPTIIAKSNIILDVKPWDDETDMKMLEESVRSITMDGLLWGASKLVAVGYGIRKLQISCVVEDDKVSTDDLEDQIVAFEDFIQSMDIVAFNKV